jgi:hypothetical protein
MCLPKGWKCLTDKVTQLCSLTTFFIMSLNLMSFAAELADTNVAGSQLIVSLQNAETGAELVDALDAYDTAILNSVTEPVAV